MKTRFLPLLTAGLLAGFLLPAPLAAAPQDAGLALTAEEAAVVGPNGIRYDEAVRRALIYTAGSQLLNQETVNALIADEVQRRKDAGIDVSHCVVEDAVVDARIASLQKTFAEKNPGVDFWKTVEAMGNTRETYREEIGRMVLVDQLFFPDDPAKWPLETLKEIFGPPEGSGDGTEGGLFAQNAASIYEQTILPTYEEVKKAHETGEEFEVGGFVAQYILRPGVMKWLLDKAVVEEPYDGLPAGVALRVNGRDFATADLLARIESLVGPVERERARMLVDTLWAVQAALDADGALLPVEEAKARIAKDREQYLNSPISYEQMQLQFLGYPSMEVFHRVHRLRESFRDRQGEVPKDEVDAHVAARLSFLGQGKADAEVIYFSARDMSNGTYAKEGDPFAEAKQRADKAAAELRAGSDWAAVLLKYSDFPEAYPGTQPGMPTPNRGRFGAMPRNQLRDFLGENDYFDFLYGISVGDQIFFDAEPGTIYGPVMGPTGWMVYKLTRRLAPEVEIDLENSERHQYLVNDDLLNVRFFGFVDEVMASE
jgi:hypothetical protein